MMVPQTEAGCARYKKLVADLHASLYVHECTVTTDADGYVRAQSAIQQTVTNWRCRQWYTFSSRPMFCHLSRWSCKVRKLHASIIVRWHHHSESTIWFQICKILASPQFPNWQHSVAGTLHTICYYTIEKSFFIKTNDYPQFQLRHFLKFRTLLSKRHTYFYLTISISK